VSIGVEGRRVVLDDNQIDVKTNIENRESPGPVPLRVCRPLALPVEIDKPGPSLAVQRTVHSENSTGEFDCDIQSVNCTSQFRQEGAFKTIVPWVGL
jgi:hypothetical protein